MSEAESVRAAVVDAFLAATKEMADVVARAETARIELSGRLAQCHAAARLFGFDLLAAAEEASPGLASTLAQITKPRAASKRTSIREIVLDAGKKAYPKPITVRALRSTLSEAGYAIHEKTVGVALNRMRKTGEFRRDGRDWYYVATEGK